MQEINFDNVGLSLREYKFAEAELIKDNSWLNICNTRKMTNQERAYKIEAKINKRLLSEIHDNELKQWHQEIFNKDIKEGCNGCYNEAFYNILKFIKLNK